MKNLIVLLLILFCFACDDEVGPELVDGPDPNIYKQIASISYELGSPFTASNWTEVFQYDDSRLIRMDSDNGLKEYSIFEYDQAGKLVEIKHYYLEENKLISKDSLAYNSFGHIASIYQFSINDQESLVMYGKTSLSYNHNRKLSALVFRNIETDEIWRRSSFTWEEGNIIKAENFSADGQLLHEWFYTYDDKRNYKLGNPAFLHDILAISSNNLIESNVVDHTGILDLACYKCSSSYSYDEHGLPKTIAYNWGTVLQIEYK